MSIADKAVWVIERNSEHPLTLNAIAEACGVSRSHLITDKPVAVPKALARNISVPGA